MIPLSYSNFKLLRECGEKFRLKNIEKVPEPLKVVFEFGSALHAGLNTALETKDKEQAQDVFEAYWNSVKGKLTDYERHGPEQLAEMGHKFIANFVKKYAGDMELVVAEKRMYAPIEDGWIPDGPRDSIKTYTDCEGTPDALVKWGGKNVLLDFKSSAYNYTPTRTEISLQLNFYAWLLTQNGYQVDELCYFVFNKGTGSTQTPYRVKYDSAVAMQMIESMVNYWKRNSAQYDKNAAACAGYKTGCEHIARCWGKK